MLARKISSPSLILLSLLCQLILFAGEAEPDPHQSPESIIKAHLIATKATNLEGILATLVPDRRGKLGADTAEEWLDMTNRYFKRKWGVKLSDVDVERIVFKTLKDQGERRKLTLFYDGKPLDEDFTCIQIDDKWYIEFI